MRHNLCLFAVEDWLSRFPSFVDDLAPCLHAYASGYRQSFKNILQALMAPLSSMMSCTICSCSSGSCTITTRSSWRIMNGSMNAHTLCCPNLRLPRVSLLPHPLRTLLLLRMVRIPLLHLLTLLPPHYLLSLWLLGLRLVPCLGCKYLPLLLPSSTSGTVPCIGLVPT